jgi:hypothetical protein
MAEDEDLLYGDLCECSPGVLAGLLSSDTTGQTAKRRLFLVVRLATTRLPLARPDLPRSRALFRTTTSASLLSDLAPTTMPTRPRTPSRLSLYLLSAVVDSLLVAAVAISSPHNRLPDRISMGEWARLRIRLLPRLPAGVLSSTFHGGGGRSRAY